MTLDQIEWFRRADMLKLYAEFPMVDLVDLLHMHRSMIDGRTGNYEGVRSQLLRRPNVAV